VTDGDEARPNLVPLSADLAAIQRSVERFKQTDRFWKSSMSRNSKLAAAVQLQHDIDSLALVLERGSRPRRPGEWFRLLRMLLRRFNKLELRYLMRLAAPVSSDSLRLILRNRKLSELDKPTRKARVEAKRHQADLELARCVLKHERDGLNPDDAIRTALEELGQISRGIEGAKKRLTRFRKAAKERGFLEPHAAVLAWTLGGQPSEPELKLSDFRDRGRPRKTDDS
jgi:hypothetical protein